LLELWVVVLVKWTVGVQSVFLEKAASWEEWGQGSRWAVKEQALVEVEWVVQVLALEPLRVDPESGLELPLLLEVEMEQE
jgi:hypothetical protein